MPMGHQGAKVGIWGENWGVGGSPGRRLRATYTSDRSWLGRREDYLSICTLHNPSPSF